MLKIPTCCKTIDESLSGGIPSNSVSLVYGEPETGKTTLALQCTVNCARQGYKTLFVDCDGKFSPRRLSQIASEEYEQIAELIILMKLNDFREQTIIMDRMTDYVTKSFGLIVFDTITSLYRLRIAETPSKTFELNRELNRQLAVLAQIAKTQRIAVLITSQVHSVLDETPISIEPVATRVLKFWADIVLALRPTRKPSVISMTLEKNPRKLASRTCDFRIEEAGMHELSVRGRS